MQTNEDTGGHDLKGTLHGFSGFNALHRKGATAIAHRKGLYFIAGMSIIPSCGAAPPSHVVFAGLNMAALGDVNQSQTYEYAE